LDPDTQEGDEPPQPDFVAIRLFFVGEQTGSPVPGLVVSLVADRAPDAGPRASAGASGGSRTLSTLQTDRAGYVSFKLDAATVAGASGLAVAWGGEAAASLPLEVKTLSNSVAARTVHVDALALPGTAFHLLGLPAVLAPDADDAVLSPGSVGMVPQLLPGGGLCQQLMPTTMAVRRYPAVQVLADVCHTAELRCGPLVLQGKMPNVEIVHGKMLEYEVVWYPYGTSLGDLLNTVTLAPCEQVNIAVVDWMRRETAARSEATDVSEQATQRMDHDRLISETMASTVTSKSTAWGVAASVGIKLPITKKLDLSASIAGGYSSTNSTQSVAASTTGSLAEHVAQASSFVASRRSTVVFQATAQEQRTYQTRTIRNHNHCHTVTFMYYQVNRSYRVVTYFRGVRPVMLVRYDNVPFDAKRAFCSAGVLKDALLDPALAGCFDALADALYCCDAPLPPANPVATSINVTVHVKDIIKHGHLYLQLVTSSGNVAAQTIATVGWQAGGTYTQTVQLSSPVDPRQVTGILASVTGSGIFGFPAILASGVEVSFNVTGYPTPIPLYSITADQTLRTGWTVQAKAEMPVPTTADNACVEASCCTRKLLAHLNCHQRYYNAVVWMNEDPNDRVMRWRCCQQDGADFPLLAGIENTPVTVYGDFVVFPAGRLVPGPYVPPVSRLVTLPTPGVYSDGVLGQCATCETVNPATFWDWKDSPCGENAPTVGDPPDPQAGVGASDLKADVISNLITFAGVPGAPDSGIAALVKTLLTSADAGSTQAKALLEKLLDSLKPSPPPKQPAAGSGTAVT
jgi:hypothetical protein